MCGYGVNQDLGPIAGSTTRGLLTVEGLNYDAFRFNDLRR